MPARILYLVCLFMIFALLRGPCAVYASETLIGRISSINSDQDGFILEVIRTSTKKIAKGTLVSLSLADENTDIKSLSTGQTVKVSVSGTGRDNSYRADKISLLKRCWCKDKTGVRYRLNRAMRHRRGLGHRGPRCPRGHNGR